MARELVGHCGIDSGCILLIDPCYLNDPMRWNPEKLLGLAKEHREKGEYREAANTERMAKEKGQLQNIISNWSKVCDDLREADHQPIEYASGVITSNRIGDGQFPVYVTKNKEGRVTKMEIIF